MVSNRMNYIELTHLCEDCRLVNDDVSCEECMKFNRCQTKKVIEEQGVV